MKTTTKKRPKAGQLDTEQLVAALAAASFQAPPGVEGCLSKVDVAHLLRVSVGYVKKMVARREFPPPDLHMGNMPRWYISTFNAWLKGLVEKEAEERNRGLRSQAQN